jgi:hypothetical protein
MFIPSNILLATDSQTLRDVLMGFLPLALFLICMYLILRRIQHRSPIAKLQKEYLEGQLKQMPRIEALLERIAKALEEKPKT